MVAVLRYPVKSAQAEPLPAVHLGRDGLQGDRVWAALDSEDGTLGSAKHPRRWGALLQVRTMTLDDGGIALSIAGRSTLAGSRAADAMLSRHVGRQLQLIRQVPETPTLHRQMPEDDGLVPTWMRGVRAGQQLVTEVAGAHPGGRFVDHAAVHLVTTGGLDRLAAERGAPVRAWRFRPNLVLDTAAPLEPGQDLRIGDAVLRVVLPTPRCIVPGLEPDGAGPVDRQLLRTLARHHRVAVAGLGRAACFGVHAQVLQPGRVEISQEVR